MVLRYALGFGLCGYVVVGCLFCVGLVCGCGIVCALVSSCVVIDSMGYLSSEFVLLVWLNYDLWMIVRLGLHIVVILV